MHIAIIVELAEIAGDKKTIAPEFRRGLFKIAPIAGKNVWPLDLNDTGFALAQNHSGFRIGDAQRDARQWHAHGASPARAIIRVGTCHVGFGHPVAFENDMSRPHEPSAVRLRKEWRGA